MRIAILGSAPSSLQLAPWDDPTWSIWGCSPGCASQQPKRVDAWFELHRWGQDWLTRDYREYLAGLGKPVHMIEPVPDVPTSVALPREALRQEFGPYFWTSTPAWMIALAITLKPEEIGFWGIDMAADGEYADQKLGLLHFIELARDRGIKITTPAESDLLRPHPEYGFAEVSPRFIKLDTRRTELTRRRQELERQIESMTKESLFLAGCLDDLNYVIRTWSE